MTDAANKSDNKRAPSSTHSAPAPKRRRRRRGTSLEAEIRRQAQLIQEQGMSEAFKAAALMVVARKLDEVKAILAAAGLSNVVTGIGTLSPTPVIQPTVPPAPPPSMTNPCVHCGRQGVYKSKPNQFNRTGSWVCRIHLPLAQSVEAEDRLDSRIAPQAVPAPSPQQVAPVPSPNPQPVAPGAASLQEAMGLAQEVPIDDAG